MASFCCGFAPNPRKRGNIGRLRARFDFSSSCGRSRPALEIFSQFEQDRYGAMVDVWSGGRGSRGLQCLGRVS